MTSVVSCETLRRLPRNTCFVNEISVDSLTKWVAIMVWVSIHESACKRGLSTGEVETLWKRGIEDTVLDDADPFRVLRISFDDAGRAWELVALVFDGGNRVLVIHAMRLRRSTIDLINRRT